MLTTRYVIDGGPNALEFDPYMTRRFLGHASTELEFVKCSVIGRDDADGNEREIKAWGFKDVY